MSSAGIYVQIILIKLKQAFSLLQQMNASLALKMFKNREFKKFSNHYTKTLVYFLYGNRMYSQVVLAYIVFQCPISALLINWLIYDQVAHEKRIFIIGLIMYELNGFIGVHLYLSLVSKKIHLFGKL